MIDLEFDEELHQYKIDGQVVPSVTQICKPLTVDIISNGIDTFKRDIAGARGTKIHNYCCDIDFNGGADGLFFDYDCIGYVNAYINFLRDYRIKEWQGVELQVASRSLGVAGTIDRLGYIENRLIILDIKTGSKIDKALLTAQLNGYFNILSCYACNYQINVLEAELWGLKLKKDGTYQVIKCKLSDIFMTLLKLEKERKEILCKNKD